MKKIQVMILLCLSLGALVTQGQVKRIYSDCRVHSFTWCQSGYGCVRAHHIEGYPVNSDGTTRDRLATIPAWAQKAKKARALLAEFIANGTCINSNILDIQAD